MFPGPARNLRFRKRVGLLYHKTTAKTQGIPPGAFCALAGRVLLLAKVWLLYSLGYGPKPSLPSGQAPFLLAERGERPPKGRIPFGNPYGQTNSGLRLRGTKGRSRLRNRSLVVPDKVPPADLYVESQGFLSRKVATGTQTQEKRTLFGRPPGPPLRGINLAHGKRCPKGGYPPLDSPTGKRTADCVCAGPKDGPACATALWLPL